MLDESTCADDFKRYLDFTNSKEYIELYNYYQRTTFLDVLGVSRQENPHSSFLRWLLDDKSSHGMGEFPLRRFIETVCFAHIKLYKGNQELAKHHEQNIFHEGNHNNLLQSIMRNKYKILSNSITREKVIENKRRVDIYAEVKIEIDKDKEYSLVILIENKVTSSENRSQKKGQAQTQEYAHYMYGANKNENVLFMFCYLSPLTNDELKKTVNETEKLAKHCSSKEFVCINYQYLVDGVIEPCLLQVVDAEAKYLLHDYLRCLGKAILDPNTDTSNENDNYLVMAVSRQEKKLVADLWKNRQHKEVMKQIFRNIGKATDTEEFETNKEFYCSIASTLLISSQVVEDGDRQQHKDYSVDISKEEKDLLEKTQAAIKNSTKKFIFEFEGKRYESHQKGEKSLGFLAHMILRRYLEIDNPDHTIEETIKKLRKKAKINNGWLMQIIISDEDVNDLKQNPQYDPKSDTDPVAKSLESFEHNFFNYKRDDTSGRKVGNDREHYAIKAYNEFGETKAYTARFFGGADIEKMANALGMHVKKLNA